MVSTVFLPAASAAVITFEDIEAGGPGTGGPVTLNNQYASLGVTFNNPKVIDYSKGIAIPNFAHSGTRAIEQCYAQEFCFSPIRIDFTAAQNRVRVWVGISWAIQESTAVQLRGFNAAGAEVARDTVMVGPATNHVPIRHSLEIGHFSPSIVRAEVSYANPNYTTNGLAVDDVEFNRVGPPPPCPATSPPTLNIMQPTSGTTVRCDRFLYRDQVTSGDPFARRTMVITAPDGTRQTFTNSASAPGMGPIWMYGLLKPGTNTITVRVEDCAGTAQRSFSINYAPLPSDARLTVAAMEVTQAIQNLSNSVPLIAGKRTVVRVFLRLTGPLASVSGVRGVMTAHRPGANPAYDYGPGLPPYQVASLNAISVDQTTNLATERSTLGGTLNFELPPEWTTAGRVHFRVRLSLDDCDEALNCDDCAYMNNFGQLRYVQFENAPPVRVRLVNMPYRTTAGGTVNTPRQTDRDHLISWLRRAYPTGRVLFSTRTAATRTGTPDSTFDADDINSTLQGIRSTEVSNGTVSSRTHYYGLVSDAGGFMRGKADGIPSRVASGPAGDGWAWDTDPTYADWYGGHELGHTFGRHHAVFCGAQACTSFLWWDICPGGYEEYPYDDGLLDGPFGTHMGFDVGDASLSLARRIYPADQWTDVMTYCDREWISDFTYKGILRRLRDENPASLMAAEPAPAEGDAIIITGTMNLTRATVTLNPFYILPNLVLSERPATSFYDIALLDAAGNPLAVYPFEPKVDTEWREGEDKEATIAETVPWSEGTRRIVIRRDGVVLISRNVTLNAPTVSVTFPNGGESLTGETATVQWTAGDTNGDTLAFALHYSTDAGETWHVVAMDLRQTSYEVNLDDIPGSSQALFRVAATDGVNTTLDSSNATFSVRTKRPVVDIFSPETNSAYNSAQVIALTGDATDIEQEDFPENQLRWTSSLQGLLGVGRSISTRLRPGQHTVTLQATDNDGESGSESIVLDISHAAPISSPNAPSVVAPGETVMLDPGQSDGVAPLSFSWALVEQPDGSTATITGPNSANASFVADRVGSYTVQLTVTDAAGGMAVARTVVVSATAISALRLGGGLEATTAANFPFVNTESGGTSAGRIDIADAVRVAWRTGFGRSGGGVVTRSSGNRYLTYGVYIDDSRLNGNPNAHLLACHQYIGEYNQAVGVWYDEGVGRWVIYNEDRSAMADGERFPYAFGPHIRAATKVANTGPFEWGVRLDDPVLNANPDAIVLATHNYRSNYVTSPLGVWYEGPAWVAYSEYGVPIPAGERVFYTDAGASGGRAIHSEANDYAGYGITLDDPRLNGNPNAILIAQHYGRTQYNPDVMGVWYFTRAGRWVVYNENINPFPMGEAVHYLIVQP